MANSMKNSIKTIATYVYGAGFLGCVGIGIHQENMKIERAKQKGLNIKLEDYAYHSFGGAAIGIISGIIWPLTACGRIIVILTPK
jgi:hypothetical protein